jgi:hypothetical protein
MTSHSAPSTREEPAVSGADDKAREELSKNNSKMTEDRGSGRGGPLGTPSHDLAEAPPSYDQEKNEVVSGGGIVDPSKDDGASSQ